MTLETKISNFNTSLYILEIHKLSFYLTHVQIMGKNHYGDPCWTGFKRCVSLQDVLCLRDYAERVDASFTHKIKSEYYSGNISVYIEGIALEHFNVLTNTGINSSTE